MAENNSDAFPPSVNPELYSKWFHQYFEQDYKELVTFVINDQKIDYSSSVLDIGCQAGWVSLELARRMPDAKILGIDTNEELIRIAEINRIEQKIENVQFQRMDLFEFKKNKYDAVISYKTLHSLPEFQILFDNIKKCLKPDGKYAVSDYRSDLKRLAKIAIWFNGATMPAEFRELWKNKFKKAFCLEEMVQILMKTKLKDWKARSSLFDFLIYN